MNVCDRPRSYACGDGAMVSPWGGGQRPHHPYIMDRWYVCSHMLLSYRIGTHHQRSSIWAPKSNPLSHM